MVDIGGIRVGGSPYLRADFIRGHGIAVSGSWAFADKPRQFHKSGADTRDTCVDIRPVGVCFLAIENPESS